MACQCQMPRPVPYKSARGPLRVHGTTRTSKHWGLVTSRTCTGSAGSTADSESDASVHGDSDGLRMILAAAAAVCKADH